MNVQKLLKAKLDRRRLIGNLGMMGAGAVITACGGAIGQPDPNPPVDPQPPVDPEPNLDAAILNFALNLEYLEAAFYLAAVGRIDEINTVGGDAEIILPEGFDGSSPIEGLNSSVMAYAEELANEELAHVLFLRSALEAAGAPVADRPVLDLSTSFVAAAQAAFDLAGITEPPFPAADFNPFAAEPFFLHGSFIFEDVGVTAYKGAARFLTNKDFLEAAAGILAAEAYHSGNIRTALYNAAEAGAYDGLPIFDIVKAISDARDFLGNPDTDKDQPINEVDITTSSTANISVTDANGVAFSRTPASVAAIVYLNAEAMPGGFFPNGISVPEDLAEDFTTLLEL